jgi:hypothetical protein
MSLKGRKSARRAFGRLRPVGRLVGRTPEGREERRTGRAETHSRPGPSSPSPRSAAKPHERRPGSADNQDRSSHPLSPEPSGGSGRPDGYETPSSGFWARGVGNCASGFLSTDEWMTCPVEHRRTTTPGHEPRNRDCIGSEEARNAVGLPVKQHPAGGETMSPLPGTMNGVSGRSEGAKPQESWQLGNGPADPCVPRSLEVHAGRDVTPPKDERAGIVTTSDSPDVWGERSEGEKPRKVSTAKRLRSPGGSTNSSQARSPGGGSSSPGSLGNRDAARVTSGGQGPREGHLLRTRRKP